ncbi:hypothetical protein RRG08_051817 [Elysia crispata]|uniref:Reverse transcriptase domain-containing protein n=1 Tax=Elysia crispata TaxID=231223 RepID=A0AAE0ZB40_9GAST|nr:hypothetical protein RRG08_051817 [Elysia crispata]
MLKERCKDKGIRLNPNKASEKQEEVTFMGQSISAKGVQPNTSKIEAILKMPAPQDIHDVRRFCGMIDSSPGRFAKSSTAHVWKNDPDPHPPTGAERQLPEVHVSQPVYYQNPEKPEWKSGQILKKKGTRSYEVQGENGGTYIRNRVHLRSKETPFQADTGDEDESALADAVIDPPLENFTTDLQPNAIPASVVSPPSSDRPKRDRQPPKWMKDFVAQ